MSVSSSDRPPPAIRASDDERDVAIVRLRSAAAEGRLTLDEFGDRIDRVLAAGERSELEAITADLPDEAAAPPAQAARKGRRWIVSIMGGGTLRGRWRVAPQCNVINVMGGSDLDLCDAIVEAAETEIRVFSLAGGATILVPPGVHTELSGFAIMGGNDLRVDTTARPSPQVPVVRVRAFSIMGGTTVKTKRAATANALPA